MSDTAAECRYKWTPESTKLLVSVWTDRQVQKQLEYSVKPQLIWESVAKYMTKKGYNVTGKQCRSRMKQVLVCYQEKKREGTYDSVEQYYDLIEKVLKIKKYGNRGIDTVDTVPINISPAKDVKTNKNLQVRHKNQRPVESLYRTEALSPAWNRGHSDNYPDSPESHETVLAQPFRVLSPVRDAATNTTSQNVRHLTKTTNTADNQIDDELPMKDNYLQNNCPQNYFATIPLQNAVDNVRNQIIQENMQQNQAILQQNLWQNQMLNQNRLQINQNTLRHNAQNLNQALYGDQVISNQLQGQFVLAPNLVSENVLLAQNNLQQSAPSGMNNKAVPQEPRKPSFRQNLIQNYAQFQNALNSQNYNYPGVNANTVFASPSISPDIPVNLNNAFCQANIGNNQNNPNMTTVTNNATFNDDTISIDFVRESPSPDEETTKLKDASVLTDDLDAPHAPLRKKKAQKIEQFMLNAINSQNDVVNKILQAQNDMVSRVLDLDRDRQSHLEKRLDHLLDIVQATVLNKSSEKGTDHPPTPPPEPVIRNLAPPPKPGVVPPKLDLVPPKPCRVPCTSSNGNFNNQNPVITRPGVVSPITVTGPTKRVGTIWSKLGPVSTSPFVKAEQQFGFRPVNSAESRTHSTVERRIAKDFGFYWDFKTLGYETLNFLNSERQIQEVVENARIKASLSQDLAARRRLFTQREPTAAIILTAAFLEAECQSTEIIENARLRRQQHTQMSNRNIFNMPYSSKDQDDIVSGQGESYDRLRQLRNQRDLFDDPNDTSTPAKLPPPPPPLPTNNHNSTETRKTVQQLTQLLMNSRRWRSTATQNQRQAASNQIQRKDLNVHFPGGIGNAQDNNFSDQFIIQKLKEASEDNQLKSLDEVDSNAKTLGWLQDRYSYGGTSVSRRDILQEAANRLSLQGHDNPMGFTTQFQYNEDNVENLNFNFERRMGFANTAELLNQKKMKGLFPEDKDPFDQLYQLYDERQKMLKNQYGNIPYMSNNGHMILGQDCMIEKYVKENNVKSKDNDSDKEEEFLDTTMTMIQPQSSKNSQTSLNSKQGMCIIS